MGHGRHCNALHSAALHHGKGYAWQRRQRACAGARLVAACIATIWALPKTFSIVASASAGRKPCQWPLPIPAKVHSCGRGNLVARSDGLKSLTVAQLKERLKTAGLPVAGRKSDLVERLTAHAEERQAGQRATKETSREELGQDVMEELEHAALEPPCEALSTSEFEGLSKEQRLSASGTTPSVQQDGAGSVAFPGTFQSGDTVDAYYDGDNKSYPAIVQKDNGNGTFLITWLADNIQYTCSSEHIKLQHKAATEAMYVIGDAVEAYSAEDETWYPAHVQRNNGDGTYTIAWAGDEAESVLEPQQIRYPTPKIPLDTLQPGQKFSGKVGRSFPFGTFIDIGAEQDGLLTPFHMYAGAEEVLARGDLVRALNGQEMYEALVQKDNMDGTIDIIWSEGEEPFRGKRDDMQLVKVAALEEGLVVDVWVQDVRKLPEGQQRLGVTLIESKAGKHVGPEIAAPAALDKVPRSKWLKGTVHGIMPFGLFVDVTPVKNGRPFKGLVHITEIREGFVENPEDEVEIGQEVKVIVKDVDKATGRLSLSMKSA